MKAIDNVPDAIAAAQAERLDLSRLAVTAWHSGEFLRLDAAVVRALGHKEVSVDDVIPGAIAGTVYRIVEEYSRETRAILDTGDVTECETEYLDLIRRVGDTSSEKFLREARLHIRSAIRLSINARYECAGLKEHYERAPIGQSFSFVVEVAQYYDDYKSQNGLIDAADVLAGEIEPVEACALCLFHPHALPLLGLKALRRLLPKAFFCAVSI